MGNMQRALTLFALYIRLRLLFRSRGVAVKIKMPRWQRLMMNTSSSKILWRHDIEQQLSNLLDNKVVLVEGLNIHRQVDDAWDILTTYKAVVVRAWKI